jgi:hypothetical protein
VVCLRFCAVTSSSDSFCVVMLQSRSFLCQVTDSGKGFSCSPGEPSQRSFRRDTPKDHKSTKMMKPSEKPFHTSALAVAPQRAPVLSGGTTLPSVRRYHLESITLGQIMVQSVAIVRLVADQSSCPCHAAWAQHPQHSIEHRSHVPPRTTATVGPPFRSQDRFNQLPLGIAELPSPSHALLLPALTHAANSYVDSPSFMRPVLEAGN